MTEPRGAAGQRAGEQADGSCVVEGRMCSMCTQRTAEGWCVHYISYPRAVSCGSPASTVAARLRALEKPEKAVQKVVVARELRAC